MALTDIFTSGATGRASKVGQQFLQNQLNDIRGLLYGGMERGIGGLEQGGAQSMDILRQFLPLAGSALGQGTEAARNALIGTGREVQGDIEGKGIPQALAQLFAGRDAALANYGPGAERANAGAQLYSDILGINGPEGSARGRAAFQSSPGFDFTLNKGLEAINRAKAASGQLVSGNTDREVQEYGSGLAQQDFGNWRSALAGYNPLDLAYRNAMAGVNTSTGQAAANTVSSGYNNLAQLISGLGQNLSGLESGYGKNLSNLYTGFGGSMAGIPMDTASKIANLIQGTGSSYANASSNISNNIANLLLQSGKASDTGTGNIFNLLKGILGLGSSGTSLGSGFNQLSNAYSLSNPNFTFGF